ncbi:MAG: hypothetical protein JST80_12000 [Bdellovibrionales bacterium]|nr:hypothetical protein [Bdellovibrionales bacterium]
MDKMVLGCLGLVSLLLSGCQGDERIAEVSTKQFEAEQQAKAGLVEKMERDLARRNRFYEGVAGMYEGKAVDQSTAYKFQIRLIPDHVVLPTDRVRMQEEVAADLEKLSFTVQLGLFRAGSAIADVACQVSGINPDIENGRIQFAPSECGAYFLIQIGDNTISPSSRTNEIVDRSRDLSRGLMSGRTQQISILNGIIQPKTAGTSMSFSVERIGQ